MQPKIAIDCKYNLAAIRTCARLRVKLRGVESSVSADTDTSCVRTSEAVAIWLSTETQLLRPDAVPGPWRSRPRRRRGRLSRETSRSRRNRPRAFARRPTGGSALTGVEQVAGHDRHHIDPRLRIRSDIPAVVRSRCAQHAGLASSVGSASPMTRAVPPEKRDDAPLPVKLLSKFRRHAPVALPREAQ